MPSITARVLLMIVVGVVLTYGFHIRPGAKRPTPIWQLAFVFVIGMFMGAIMLTTHSLYISGHA